MVQLKVAAEDLFKKLLIPLSVTYFIVGFGLWYFSNVVGIKIK